MKRYDTETLRRHFLVEQVFVTGELKLVYSHVDRVVFGGAVPTTQALALEGGKAFGTPNFLDRRELGVINLGGDGRVLLDGETRHPGQRRWTLRGHGGQDGRLRERGSRPCPPSSIS